MAGAVAAGALVLASCAAEAPAGTAGTDAGDPGGKDTAGDVATDATGGDAQGECTPTDPPDEVCDGKDNDCNGQTDEATCDDGDACTVDLCYGDKGCGYALAPNGQPCEDGAACTLGDLCKNGQCTPGTATCDDGNLCTDDTCDGAAGCKHLDNDRPCDDGNACTYSDRCYKGSCLDGPPNECNDGNPCTDDACDAATGCKHVANTATCNDNNACTGGDWCSDMQCKPGAKVVCDDGDPCTNETCDSLKGCKSVPIPDPCDPGNPCIANPSGPGCKCTADDKCASGFCIDTPEGQQCAGYCASSCKDGFKCATASGPGGDVVNICVPKYGKVCNPCSKNADCEGPGNGGARCVDHGDAGAFCGSACTVDGDCPAGHACAIGKDVAGQTSKQCVVKDGGDCTCSQAAKDLQLSSECYGVAGVACVGRRTCLQSGLTQCTLSSVPDLELCDAKDNDCDGQTDEATCDDGNACTADTCNGSGGCSHSHGENGQQCDADLSACTQDLCLNGKCTAGPVVVCDDGNVCTDDSCHKALGCQHVNNAAACSDGNPCTVDKCVAGACTASPVVCDSQGQCWQGECSLQTGMCKYTYKSYGVPCDDGNPCTVGDSCGAGKCHPGAMCDDKDPCTTDSCDKLFECTHKPAAAGPCNADDSVCTAGDACVNGECKPGAKVTCDDKNLCTTDTCSPLAGCLHVAKIGQPCNDGKNCTANDTCKDGVCQGDPVDAMCDDKNPCTTDTCDKLAECIHAPIPGC